MLTSNHNNLIPKEAVLEQEVSMRIPSLPFSSTEPTFIDTSTSRISSEEENSLMYTRAAEKIRSKVRDIIEKDATFAGPILRLAFHDAVVRSVSKDPNIGGSDGSIRYELDWSENRGLSRPLKVVQEIYESQLQQEQLSNLACTSDYNGVTHTSRKKCETLFSTNTQQYVLSFADTLALCGAAAVETAKGPKIPIKLGRSDMLTADNRLLDSKINGETERSSLVTSLPAPNLDSLGIRVYFQRLNFTDMEMVALMGAHDLGRHVTLLDMPKDCIKNLTRLCLENAPVSVPFVTQDPDTLSNKYYQTLLRWNDREIGYGEALFIPTDVAMVVDDELRKIVISFAKDEGLFFQTFKQSYQKLVDTTARTNNRY